MLWGHLIPLPPAVQCDATEAEAGPVEAKSRERRRRDCIIKPLNVPGSYGREELLRPFSKSCHACRRRRGSAGSSTSPRKNGTSSSRPPLCNSCRSIHSVAKFIPRKDFLRFSRLGGGDVADGKSLILSVAGKSASRLVRVFSSDGNVRESNDPQANPKIFFLTDGDIVSLLCYDQQRGGEGVINSSLALDSLVQFQLAKTKEVTPGIAVNSDLADDRAAVPLLVMEKKDTHIITGEKSTIQEKSKRNKDDDAKVDCHEDEKKEVVHDESKNCQSEINVTGDKGDDSSTSESKGPRNAGSVFKASGDNWEIVVRGNHFRDAPEKDEDNCSNMKQQDLNRPERSPRGPNQAAVTCEGYEFCAGSVNDSALDDEESESAPLSLPSRFLASCSKSFSFDAAEIPSPQHLKRFRDENTRCSQRYHDTPRNIEIGGKRTHDDLEATNGAASATKTPKKSNITNLDAKTSAPIYLFSYDQLVKLHEETNPLNSAVPPSLRHVVLSLTLALTSNASSWDPNFLNDCNAGATARSGTKRNDEPEPLPRCARQQQWMPRLLQGTHIKLRKKVDAENT